MASIELTRGRVFATIVILVHLVGVGLTGTSVNPARSLATAIGTAIYGGGTQALAQVWMFIVAPLAGAAAEESATPASEDAE